MNLLHNVACVLCNDTCDGQYIGGGVFGAELSSLCNVVCVLHNGIDLLCNNVCCMRMCILPPTGYNPALCCAPDPKVADCLCSILMAMLKRSEDHDDELDSTGGIHLEPTQ